MIRLLLLGISLLTVALVGAALVVRFAQHDPEIWHLDPETAAQLKRPNNVKMLPDAEDLPSPVFAIPVDELAMAFTNYVAQQPNAEILAGAASDLHVTFVVYSKLMRFPDYVSVKFMPAGDGEGSTFAAYSRSRFGYSDRGVNRARLISWSDALEELLPTR